jgi:Trypsin-co-occurring domain 1
MIRLVEYPVADGSSILVEVNVPTAETTLVPAASPGQLIGKAQESLGEALERIVPAANAVITKLHALSDAPDGVEVTFGVKLTGGTNVIFASGEVEANFIVKLSWTLGPTGI